MIHPSSNTNEYFMLIKPQSMQTRHLLWFYIQNVVENIKDFGVCPGLLDHLHSKAVLSKDESSSNEVQFVLKWCAHVSKISLQHILWNKSMTGKQYLGMFCPCVGHSLFNLILPLHLKNETRLCEKNVCNLAT